MADPLATDPGLAGLLHRAVPHQAHVEGGAARIADDHVVAEALHLRIGQRRDWRHGRAGLDRVDGPRDQLVDVHAAADRGAHQNLALASGFAEIVLHAAQMRLHQRLERGVDGGGGCAPVFAHDGDQPVREGVGDARQNLLDQRGKRLLVRGVGDRPQQTDGDRLEAALAHEFQDRARLLAIQRRHHAALGIDPLVDLEGVSLRDVGVRVIGLEVVDPVLAALLQHQDVGEAGGHQERGLGDRALDDRVGGARRSVDEQIGLAQKLGQAQAQLLCCVLQRAPHADEDAIRRGRRLADHLPPVPAGHHIGKGAAGIDGDAKPHGGAPWRRELSPCRRRSLPPRRRCRRSRRHSPA